MQVRPQLCLVLFLLLTLASAAQVERLDFPDLVDAVRKRRVPILVHKPSQSGPHPVVVTTHGAGDSRFGFYALASHLAGQGYLVVSVEHVGSNTEKLKRGGIRNRAHYIEKIKGFAKDISEQENRPRDVSFALDCVEKWTKEPGPLQGTADLNHIALMGHSYGAFTTLVSCGAKAIELDRRLEPRVDLGIALSPQGPNGFFFNERSFDTIAVPFVCISGSKDVSLVGGEPDFRKEAYRRMPPRDKHLIWIHDADHISFSDPGQSETKRRYTKYRADVTRVLRPILTTILNHYLKGTDTLDNREDYLRTLPGGTVKKLEWMSR